MNLAALRKRYHVLIKQACISEDERQAILSGAGVESSKDLSAEQLSTICDALQKQVDNRYNPPLEVRRLRSRVIDWLQRNGYYEPNGTWDKANAFLEQPRIAGKRLYLLSETDLKELVKKLAAIENKAKAARLQSELQKKWN